MSQLRVESFTVSIDGFSAGPKQSLEHPLGVGAEGLHTWAWSTRSFQRTILGRDEGATEGVDADFAARGFENIGAWILGRNMFAPSRGPWTDDGWLGWWGENPVYHCEVFVLTHHPRPPLVMAGGTTFHFVTTGLADAVAQAREAAGGRDVRLGGGAHTIRQGLRERLIDTMHIAMAPVLLGSGENLFAGIDLSALGYAVTQHAASPRATHLVITRQPA